MSLYAVQKFLYELNRSDVVQRAFVADADAVLGDFDLTPEESAALTAPDIGLLFHLGVNGQILMHYAAFHQIEWQDYLQRMRDGISTHGPVREGIYAMTTAVDERVAPVHAADPTSDPPSATSPVAAPTQGDH